MSNDSSLRDAITYLLDEAEPHGLELECLEYFMVEVSHLLETLMQLSRDDYMMAANVALYEWDI